jgi:hypothetical protein
MDRGTCNGLDNDPPHEKAGKRREKSCKDFSNSLE